MQRDYDIYIDDILGSIKKIEAYTKGKSQQEFMKNSLLVDGVIRNLEIIGEAVKKIPAGIKKNHPKIEWNKIAGLRDILIHEYFGINLEIVWDVIINKLPALRDSTNRIKKSIK